MKVLASALIILAGAIALAAAVIGNEISNASGRSPRSATMAVSASWVLFITGGVLLYKSWPDDRLSPPRA